MIDRGQRLRIMGGKLREDHIRIGQQLAGAGNIGNVGVDFARIDRKLVQTIYLGALDFRIPIGPLHKTHHHTVIGTTGKINDEIKHERAALAIGLHHEADTFPACKGRIEAKLFEKVQ